MAAPGSESRGIVEAVLLEGEVVLAGGLGGDGDEERVASAEFGLEVAPGFEFGDAVGVPAAAEEVDDEGAEGEEVGGVDGFVGAGVFEGEGRGLGADLQDAVFDAGVEEVGGGLFGDGEALGLDEGSGVLGDAVELVLQRLFGAGGHGPPPPAKSVQSLRSKDFRSGLRRKSRRVKCCSPAEAGLVDG